MAGWRDLGAAAVLGAALAAALAGPVVADEDCGAYPTQMEMNACAGRNAAAADAELNRLYGQVVTRLAGDEAASRLLRDAQRAWIGFRDADCAFASSGVEGGSIQPMIHAGCLQSATETRNDTLRGWLACEEGDLSCPLPPE